MSNSQTWIRALLQSLSLCCLALFCFTIYARPTDWYSKDQGFVALRNAMTINLTNVQVLTREVIKKNKTVTELAGKNAVLVSGSSLFPLVLVWAPTLGIAICGSGLLYLAQLARLKRPAGNTRAFKRLRVTAHYIAHYQLPPTQFWAHWSGGMSIVDAILVCAWIGLAVCYLYNNISSKFENISASLPANDYLVKRLTASAKAFGEVLRILLLLMFYPVSRSNVLAWVFRTDHSTLVRYHRWMGYGTVGVAFFHGLMYCTIWGSAGTLKENLTTWPPYKQSYLTGLIAMIAGLVIIFTSMPWVRRRFYYVFYYSHIVGFLVWTIFSLMHYKALANWIVPGLVLYAVDRAFRMWQTACNVVKLSAEDVLVNGAIITLRLRWPKGAHIAAGQTLYIRCRSISLLQAHPFTLSSVSHPEPGDKQSIITGLLHIRAQGPWTLALRELAAKGHGLTLQVEGPYESTLLHKPQTRVVVMIAGGMGFTPIKGLLQAYSNSMSVEAITAIVTVDMATEGGKAGSTVKPGDICSSGDVSPPRVYLMWSCRKLCELQLLGADLLNAAVQTAQASKLGELGASIFWLQARLYYTGLELERPQSQDHTVDAGAQQLSPTPCSSVSDHNQMLTQHQSALSLASASDDGSGPSKAAVLAGSPSINPSVFIPAAILSSLGAFGGLVLAWYYDAYCARTTTTGANYAGVGAVQFASVAAGAIVPPLFYLLVCKLVQMVGCRLGWRPEHDAGLSQSASKGQCASLEASAAGVVALPGYQLAALPMGSNCHASANLPEVEAGLGALQLNRGRPDIRALLDEVYQQHSQELEIEVLAAGPEAMYLEVLSMCQQLSNKSWGGIRGPVMRCRAVVHQH